VWRRQSCRRHRPFCLRDENSPGPSVLLSATVAEEHCNFTDQNQTLQALWSAGDDGAAAHLGGSASLAAIFVQV
jgi:hypothetical protein